MKPIRTYAGGLYEIYGQEDGRPWMLAVDKLDVTLSLGKGKIGARDWEPGLRDTMITDRDGNKVAVCEAQIAAYAERWANKIDPPHPEILVLARDAGNGIYKHTPTVIDGAMWVVSAPKAGVGEVAAYAVHPTLPHIEPEAMWLYFNTVKNGLPPTSKQRERVLKELARHARDDRGITDVSEETAKVNGKEVKVKQLPQWIADCARATGTAVDLIKEATKGIFATRRSAEQRAQDRKDIATGKKSVGQVSRESGKSRTAVRKDAKRHGVDPSQSRNGHKAKKEAEDVVDSAVKKFGSAINGEAKDALDRIQQAAATLKPAVHELVAQIEKLTNGVDLDAPSYAERVAQARKVWVDVVDYLWTEMKRLARQLKIHSERDLAKRDIADLEEMVNIAAVALGRGPKPVAQALNGDQRNGKQVALSI